MSDVLDHHHLTQAEKKQMIELVQKAADQLFSFWPGNKAAQSGGGLTVEHKEDGSPVSNADLASNLTLMSGITSLFPHDAILSEEEYEQYIPGMAERVWIIDPLDGTKSFIEGRDDFSVLLALSVRGRVEFSVMNFPARRLVAISERGVSVQVNEEAPRVSESQAFRNASIYFRNFIPAESPLFYDRWMDSGLAFLTLARGGFDGIIIHMTRHRTWDLAAPSLIIEEAGGKVTDEFGNLIDYGKGIVPCQYVVASNGILHSELIKFIPKAS